MTIERVTEIQEMVPGWNETDQYEEDYEKTEVVEELLAELDRLGKENSQK